MKYNKFITFLSLFSLAQSAQAGNLKEDLPNDFFVKINSEYSTIMLNYNTTNINQKQLFLLQERQDGYLKDKSLYIGTRVIGLLDYQNSNVESKFGWLMRHPTSNNQIGKDVSEAVVHSVQVGFTGNILPWVTTFAELLYDPQQSFGQGTITSIERNEVQVRKAYVILGERAQIRCKMGGLSAKNIYQGVTVNVRGEIIVKNIAANCNIASSMYGLNAENIGKNTVINVRDKIRVNNIDSAAQLKSDMYGVTANDLGENVNIMARDPIEVRNVGKGCRLTSSMYGITTGKLYDKVIINARDAVVINSLGDSCHLSSTMYGVRVLGASGNNLTISCREAVSLGNVGKRANISSSMYGIVVGNLGPGSNLTARDDIEIKGVCSEDAMLNSSMGKVYKRGPTKSTSFFGAESKPASQEAQVPKVLSVQ